MDEVEGQFAKDAAIRNPAGMTKGTPHVVFCDNQILVADKPAGWLTQPDGSSSPALETEMKAWVKKKYEKKGEVFLHAIHRLDRPVSGLVLFARTSKALSRLNEEVRAGNIQRHYLAEVEGIIKQKEGVLEHFLEHGDHRAIVALKENPHAKRARLHFRVVGCKAERTQVAIELETGRYHQIRAQFAAIGHPIVGDARYGSRFPKEEIHLHCAFLSLIHPVTKAEISFKSDPIF